MIDARDFCTVFFCQLNILLFIRASHLPQVHEKDLALTVTEAFYFTVFFNHTSLFILVQNPKRNADVRGVEEVSGKNDDCFDEIVLDELTADF